MLDSKPLDLPGDLEEGELAVYLAWLRIGAATAAFVAPGAVTHLWTGEDGPPTLTRTVLRSWAGREAALGIGLLMSLRHDKGVRGWLEGGALADASDDEPPGLAAPEAPLAGGCIGGGRGPRDSSRGVLRLDIRGSTPGGRAKREGLS